MTLPSRPWLPRLPKEAARPIGRAQRLSNELSLDGTELRISEREGIEIDYCPQCLGVWLDRGELDKVLERSARALPSDDRIRDRDRYGDERRASRDRDERDFDRPSRDRGDSDYDDDRGSGRKSRRRSMLEDLLDFD